MFGKLFRNNEIEIKLQSRIDKIQSDLDKVLSANEQLKRAGLVLLQRNADKDREICELKEQIDDLRSGIDVTAEFREVASVLKRGDRLIFVHGGAGTGKSTLIKWLRKKGLIDVLLAPTGLAALNIHGATIHKFFGFPPVALFPRNGKKNPLPEETMNILKNKPTICIDETSMVRSDLIDAIDQALRGFPDIEGELFGGYQIVFVGDLFQLPPVVTKQAKSFFDPTCPDYQSGHGWESAWFLDADALRNQRITRIDLTYVFRQKNSSEFVRILNDFRRYKNIPNTVNFFRRIPVHSCAPVGSVIVVGTNIQADDYNNQAMQKLSGRWHEFEATRTGVFAEFEDRDLPAKVILQLKVGTFVMLIYNDEEERFVNGSTGKITEICFDYADVRLKDGCVVRVGLHTWESYKVIWNGATEKFENKLDGTFTQLPMIPAYAITCHKAQGKTLEDIYIDVNPFAPGQMYVALSRTKNPSGITMRRALNTGDIKRNQRLDYFLSMGKI